VMMGGKTPETCWAVNKRDDNKLENCCIWLVIYLNCTMMHGLTNLKPYSSYTFRPLIWPNSGRCFTKDRYIEISQNILRKCTDIKY
jgi:hypothetical protein